MAYQVLALKWRPQLLDEVVGQEHVTRTLANAITNHRLGHAFIFSGPRGVGKTTTARILAKTVNCKDREGTNPCNRCTNCLEITRGSSLDVQEIDGASNRGIDEIRELQERVRYKPTSSPFKIVIIDEVHMLTQPAFNALLKTIEEPPDHVKFVLATTEVHKVPATILSRCQRHEFRRIPLEIIFNNLKQICEAESISISDEALHILARVADGSLRDGQSILDQVIAYFNADVNDKDLIDLLGRLDTTLVGNLVKAVLDGETAEVLLRFHEYVDQGRDLELLLNEMIAYVRDVLVLQVVPKPPPSMLARGGEEMEDLAQVSRKHTIDQLSMVFQVLNDTIKQVRSSDFATALLDVRLVELSRLDRLVSLEELTRRLDGIAAMPADSNLGRRTPSPQPAASPPAAPRAGQTSHHDDQPGKAAASRTSAAEPAKPQIKSAPAQKAAEPDSDEKPASHRRPPVIPEPALNPTIQFGSRPRPGDRELWATVVEELRNHHPILSGVLEFAAFESDRNEARILFPSENDFYFHEADKRANRRILEKTLAPYFQPGMSMQLMIQEQPLQTLIEQKRNQRKAQRASLKEDVLKNPSVKRTMELFSAQISGISERKPEEAADQALNRENDKEDKA